MKQKIIRQIGSKIIGDFAMKKKCVLNDLAVKKAGRGVLPVFSQIEIETINRCNGTCEFCPVNANMPQREYHKMTDVLFEKIINELSLMGYENRIALSSNNEPFLDDRIERFAAIARQKCPNAFIFLWTNGTLLSIDRMKDLIENVDRVYIDSYSEGGSEINSCVKEIEVWLSNQRIEYSIHDKLEFVSKKKVVIFLRDSKEVLSSRGGQAPNKKGARALKTRCLAPFDSFIIRPDGLVSLCCNDALGKYTLGDVNTDSICDIWNNSPEYKRVRTLMLKGRKELALCSKCDFFYEK